MFQVPGPIKTLFETFPLKTYPPILSEQNGEGFVYFVSKKPSNSSSPKFTLGVHGLAQIEGKTLPTDPISLAYCLILCHRHEISLPKSSEKSAYRMTVLSYKASPTNELPILVEHSNDVNSVIKPEEMQKSIGEKTFGDSVIELLVNSFLDDLSELWILILLSDLASSQQATFSRIFNSLDVEGNNFESLLVAGLLGDIPAWSSFKTKYPSLFYSSSFHSTIKNRSLRDGYYRVNKTALQALLFEKLCSLEKNLPLVWDYIAQSEKSEATTILELKIAAFVFVIDEFIPESTHVGRMIKKDAYVDIVKKSRQIVLERY